MTNYVGGYHMGRAHGLLQVPLTAWLSPGNITDGFANAVGHGFEHHDARETLLHPYGDVHRAVPYGGGKEQHQQVARMWAGNLWVSLR